MPRNLSKVDRRKNQFDKEERAHLLGIMKQYAPLLDKSASTLARKKIWTTIEYEFKKAGFTRKTSAQLKKYWQNYKYHCKKSTAFGKENTRYVNSVMSESVEWNRYQVLVDNRSGSKFSEIPEVVLSLADHLHKSPTKSDCRFGETYRDRDIESYQPLNAADVFIDLSRVKMEQNDDETTSDECKVEGPNLLEEERNIEEDTLNEKKESSAGEDHLVSSSTNAAEIKSNNRIVVSNAKIFNNSVIVSVIYPENDNAHLPRSATDRTVQLRSSNASLPTKMCKVSPLILLLLFIVFVQLNQRVYIFRVSAHATGDERANKYAYSNSTEAQGVDAMHVKAPFNIANEPSDRKEFKSSRRNANEDDQEFTVVKSVENDGSNVRAKRGYVFLTDYHNRLKHRLLLQQLETEEKRLKVKIAEMTIQEVQLRIKALSEEMRRTEELHQLSLARIAVGRNDERLTSRVVES
ncbi:uncharacterized protein LOC143431560 [Xylocopa sonorina]|uniref:uncharacterized protein LOC143431560 n=1 Tax=Xylocopa sonorina TaxID=1818115 RepID=UPI00403AF79D